jgi:hypothetical protein
MHQKNRLVTACSLPVMLSEDKPARQGFRVNGREPSVVPNGTMADRQAEKSIRLFLSGQALQLIATFM